MTIQVPGSMDRRGSPSFPWTPTEIEELTEVERRLYLEYLREFRAEFAKTKKK